MINLGIVSLEQVNTAGESGGGFCACQRFTLYITASKKDKTPTEVFPF